MSVSLVLILLVVGVVIAICYLNSTAKPQNNTSTVQKTPVTSTPEIKAIEEVEVVEQTHTENKRVNINEISRTLLEISEEERRIKCLRKCEYNIEKINTSLKILSQCTNVVTVQKEYQKIDTLSEDLGNIWLTYNFISYDEPTLCKYNLRVSELNNIFQEEIERTTQRIQNNGFCLNANYIEINNGETDEIKGDGEGNIIVNSKYLMNRYLKNAILGDDLLFKCLGNDFIKISQKELDFLENERITRIQNEKIKGDYFQEYRVGRAYEKEGMISDAISTYEGLIERKNDFYSMDPFDRLLVLYRKQKDYENEKRICEIAISLFDTEEKYKSRLVKINALIEKSK